MWDLSRSGMRPTPSTLSCKFFTNEPPGKPISFVFVRAAIIKCHRKGGLNNRAHFLIVLEAESLSPICQQVYLFLGSLSWVCGWLSSHCVLMWSFVHKCASLTPLYVSALPFLTKTSHTGLGPTLMPSLQLKHLYQGTVFKSNHLLRSWEVGLQHISLWGIQCSSFTPFHDFPTNSD